MFRLFMERLFIKARAHTHAPARARRISSFQPALFQFNYSTPFQYIPFF